MTMYVSISIPMNSGAWEKINVRSVKKYHSVEDLLDVKIQPLFFLFFEIYLLFLADGPDPVTNTLVSIE